MWWQGLAFIHNMNSAILVMLENTFRRGSDLGDEVRG